MTLNAGLRLGRIELPIGLLLLATIVGAGIGLALARSTPVAPGVTVSPGGLDFGTVWEQPAYRHEFTLTNPTDQPIRVAEIKTGCGCTRVEPQNFTLKPGETRSLVATLNLTGYGGRLFEVELHPILAHQPPNRRTAWTLRGTVQKNPIVLSEPSISFGAVIQEEPLPTREIDVSLDEGSPFDELAAEVIEGKGQAKLAPTGNGRWRLLVMPAEGLPPGPFKFVVRVEPKPPAADSNAIGDVTVTGTVRGDIAAWPPTMNFGVLEVGETGREYVVLSSHRGRPFAVTGVETPEGVSVELANEQLEGGSKTFVVTQKAQVRGNQKGAIVFNIQHGTRNRAAAPNLTLELHYIGTTIRND